MFSRRKVKKISVFLPSEQIKLIQNKSKLFGHELNSETIIITLISNQFNDDNYNSLPIDEAKAMKEFEADSLISTVIRDIGSKSLKFEYSRYRNILKAYHIYDSSYDIMLSVTGYPASKSNIK